METIHINGIRLAFERRGGGAPMVLLHGYPLDHHLWDDVAPLLSDTFELIVPDLRGFGGSSTVDAFYTSEIGFRDIDYRGNAPMASYPSPVESIEYAVKKAGL